MWKQSMAVGLVGMLAWMPAGASAEPEEQVDAEVLPADYLAPGTTDAATQAVEQAQKVQAAMDNQLEEEADQEDQEEADQAQFGNGTQGGDSPEQQDATEAQRRAYEARRRDYESKRAEGNTMSFEEYERGLARQRQQPRPPFYRPSPMQPTGPRRSDGWPKRLGDYYPGGHGIDPRGFPVGNPAQQREAEREYDRRRAQQEQEAELQRLRRENEDLRRRTGTGRRY